MERIEQSYEGYVFYNNSNNLNQQHQREKRIIVQPTGDKNTSRAKGMTRCPVLKKVYTNNNKNVSKIKIKYYV